MELAPIGRFWRQSGRRQSGSIPAGIPPHRTRNFRWGEIDRFYLLAPVGATQREAYAWCEFLKERNISTGGSEFFASTPYSETKRVI